MSDTVTDTVIDRPALDRVVDRVVDRLDLADADGPTRLVLLVALASEGAADGTRGRFVLEGGHKGDPENGVIVFFIGDRALVLADTAALVRAGGIEPARLVAALNADPALLVTLADGAGLVPLHALDTAFQDGFLSAVDEGVGLSRAMASGGGLPVRPNEATLLDHLDPLGLASDYFSVALERTSFANLFGRVTAGVGADLAHLPPLPDENYARGIDPTVFDVLDQREAAAPPPLAMPEPPVPMDDAFDGTEDVPITGDLSANDIGVPAGATYEVETPPATGTLTMDPGGTFSFVPAPNVSGTVTFDYAVIDPASGTRTVATAMLTIAPVADAPALTGGAFTTPEDTSVALDTLAATLVDRDGSETLTLRLTGVPAGAVVTGASDLGGGVWAVDPADVGSLTVTPPRDFSGMHALVDEARASVVHVLARPVGDEVVVERDAALGAAIGRAPFELLHHGGDGFQRLGADQPAHLAMAEVRAAAHGRGALHLVGVAQREREELIDQPGARAARRARLRHRAHGFERAQLLRLDRLHDRSLAHAVAAADLRAIR